MTLRIVIVNRHRKDALGGSEIQCDFLASGLTDRGHEVIYVAPDGHKTKDYETSYRVVPCPSTGEEIGENVLALHPDIVYWRYNKIEFYKSVRKIKRGDIPIIFAVSHIEDITKWIVKREYSGKKKLKFMFKNRWNYLGMRYVNALTVNNKDFLGKVNLPVQRYIPNGMNISHVPFSWPRPYIAWIANIKQTKRPEIYVKLAREFESAEVDFLMAGKIQEPGYDWLKDRTSLPDNFHYLGPKSLEETNGILADCDFLVHTCKPEGFPNVFIQSWLLGKPTISYEFDPCGYIASEKTGFCAAHNWKTFVGQVRHLMDHPEECRLIGEQAARFAERMFTVERFVDRTESLLKEIADNGPEVIDEKKSGTESDTVAGAGTL